MKLYTTLENWVKNYPLAAIIAALILINNWTSIVKIITPSYYPVIEWRQWNVEPTPTPTPTKTDYDKLPDIIKTPQEGDTGELKHNLDKLVDVVSSLQDRLDALNKKVEENSTCESCTVPTTTVVRGRGLF